MSVIVDTYRKAKRKYPDRLVLFEAGLTTLFILEDARTVSRLLGEPLSLSAVFGCEAVTFGKPRVPEIVSRLDALKYKLVAFQREDRPPHRWLSVSLESSPDLSRLTFASNVAYEDALAELKAGKMETNWLWFAFPRMDGKWNAQNGDGHGFRTLRESRLFLKRKALAARLREMVGVLLSNHGKTADEIFGATGALHLKASATLFALTAKAADDREAFALVLQRFFDGSQDEETVEAIRKELETRRDDTPKDLALLDGSITVLTSFNPPIT